MIKSSLSTLNKIIVISFLLFSSQHAYSRDFFDVPLNDSLAIRTASKSSDNIEDEKLSKKYAELLKLDENEVNKFLDLYKFIDGWMGTPYKWGGCDKKGIDCSCFIMTLFDNVFDIKIKRTTFTQFYDNDISLFRSRSEFQTGDLIFFKTAISRETRNNLITHVGMYLANGYFIQSSSSGVNIGNLNSGYWKSCFVAAGRLKEKYYKKNSKLLMPQGAVEDSKNIQAADENADFDPVPYPEDLDELKGKYAAMLGIDSSLIVIPEMFEYIDKYRYAPYNITKECPYSPTSGDNCFVHNFYKDVLNLDINLSAAAIASQKQTAKLKEKNVPSAFDIILIRTGKKQNNYDVTGIYLYNNFFLHIAGNEVVISNTQDSTYTGSAKDFYRIDADLLRKGKFYIDSLRKNPDPNKFLHPHADSSAEKNNSKNAAGQGNTDNTTTTVKEQAPVKEPAVITAKENQPAPKTEKENTAGKTIIEDDPLAQQKALEAKRALEREQIRKEVLEKLERERIEKERTEAERIAKKREEEIRIEVEKIERKRIADELAEKKRLDQERVAIEIAERKRIADELAEKKRLEQKRIADELAEKKRLEKERIAIEIAERKRIADEKAEAARLEQKRIADELAEKKRLDQERIAIEIAERKKIADEKAEAARLEQKRIADELAEKKRLDQERIAIEIAERKRIADEKAEAARLEQKRIADELAEKKRLEQERIEFENAERIRIAAEKAEAQRLERLRIAAEKAEAQRLERKRIIDEQRRKDSIIKMAQLDEQFEKRRQEALKADAEWKEKKKKEQEEELERIRLEKEKIIAEKIRIEQEELEKKKLEKEKKKAKS
jgi:hypothetical protein